MIAASSWRSDPARRVAGIGEDALAGAFAGFVERQEIGPAQIDLAAHFEHRRRGADQASGDVAHGLQIRAHVLADRAVAAGRAEDEDPVLVAQRDRQPVDLGLGQHRDRLGVVEPQESAHPCVEFGDVRAPRRRWPETAWERA